MKKIDHLKIGQSSLQYYIDNKHLLTNSASKVMISPESIDSLITNYNFFVHEMNILCPDFTIVRDNIWSDTDIIKFDEQLIKLTNEQIKNIKNGVWSISGMHLLALSDIILNDTNSKRPFGCFAGNNGAAFFPSGEIYPCARFGSNREMVLYTVIDKNIIETYNNPILNDNTIYNPIHYIKCKTCDIYQYCNSGCLYEQLHTSAEGSIYIEPVDCVCELFKIIYRESIRMWDELRDNTLFKTMLMKYLKQWG